MFQPGYFRVQTVYRYDTLLSPSPNLIQMETQRKAAKARSSQQAVEFVSALEASEVIFQAASVLRK
jgi:hypothetical protein